MDKHLFTFRQLNALKNLPLMARDGAIGHCADFYIDDVEWQVRYLIADIGSWLEGRRVLLSPAALQSAENDQLNISLTQQQIKDSPPTDWTQPISRHYETALFDYYQWQPYWRPPIIPGDAGGMIVVPPLTRAAAQKQVEQTDEPANVESTLRSVSEIIGYDIQGLDGTIGHLEDFVVNLDGWHLRFFVVDTRNWLPGKKVVLPPTWITNIDWANRRVQVELSEQTIKSAPELDIDALNEAAVEQFYNHFDRTVEKNV